VARVVVVGGGFGGLASAARLAKLGHAVTLLEAAPTLGGALRPVEQDGFTWDGSATTTLLPAVVRDLFRKSGRPLERELDLEHVEVIREHRFADKTSVRLPGGSRAAQVAAFDELIAAGKIRSWGVSNFDADDLGELLAVAGKGKIACNQVLYHLQERAIEHAVIPWCEKHGTAVVAYSPFGHNDFPSSRSKAGELLQTIADAHKATAHQVALGFLTRSPSVFAIPKASSAEHAADNAAAGKLKLSESEIAALDKAFPRGPKPRGLPML